MTSKKRAEFVSIKVKCVCGIVLDLTQADFTGHEHECESCGSHGSVGVGFMCPECKKYQDIELSGW